MSVLVRERMNPHEEDAIHWLLLLYTLKQRKNLTCSHLESCSLSCVCIHFLFLSLSLHLLLPFNKPVQAGWRLCCSALCCSSACLSLPASMLTLDRICLGVWPWSSSTSAGLNLVLESIVEGGGVTPLYRKCQLLPYCTSVSQSTSRSARQTTANQLKIGTRLVQSKARPHDC